MIEKIATEEDIVRIMKEKTGLSEQVIKANMKYIKNRVQGLMEEENVHLIRMAGLGSIMENYKILKMRSLTHGKPETKSFLQNKLKSLRAELDKFPLELVRKFYKKQEFLNRKRHKKTDEELEELQNN